VKRSDRQEVTRDITLNIAMILPDLVRHADDLGQFPDSMNTDDVRAAEDSGRHCGSGRPIA
jgi:hypothetical protein